MRKKNCITRYVLSGETVNIKVENTTNMIKKFMIPNIQKKIEKMALK
ncbi:hypothetical protein ACFL20_04660 [Spirochaetota bacterium]